MGSAVTVPGIESACKNFEYLTLFIRSKSGLLCFPSGPRSTNVYLANLNE